MIDTHKIVIKYKIEHKIHYVNKYINNLTSLQMARISLIDENLIIKITVEILFCLMSILENCLISRYLFWLSTRVQME